MGLQKVSDRTLQLLLETIRNLDFELKTGRSANITLSPIALDKDQITQRFSVYVNDVCVAKVVEHLIPF